MSMLQFISSSGGCGIGGKKHSVKTKIKNSTENKFTANPYRPRLNLRSRSCSLRYRFRQTQEIETM